MLADDAVVTLQLSARVDNITSDGTELTQLPYPFHVGKDGFIGRQDFWDGKPSKVIGFVSDLSRQEVDLWWPAAWSDLQAILGMYLITADSTGEFSTHTLAIQSVSVR